MLFVATREFSKDNIFIKLKSCSTDCYLDKATSLNSANTKSLVLLTTILFVI